MLFMISLYLYKVNASDHGHELFLHGFKYAVELLLYTMCLQQLEDHGILLHHNILQKAIFMAIISYIGH
jgi:hypothetical protein